MKNLPSILLLVFLLTPCILSLTPSIAFASTINSSSAVNLSSGLVGYWTFDGKDTNWATGKTNDVSGII